jgi:hypothetical protein
VVKVSLLKEDVRKFSDAKDLQPSICFSEIMERFLKHGKRNTT